MVCTVLVGQDNMEQCMPDHLVLDLVTWCSSWGCKLWHQNVAAVDTEGEDEDGHPILMIHRRMIKAKRKEKEKKQKNSCRNLF